MSATAPASLPAASPVTTDALMDQLRAAGAPQWDAVGWHYTQVLAERTRTQTGQAQALLHHKLMQALVALQARMHAASAQAPAAPRQPTASPLASLLRDMGHNGAPDARANPARHKGDESPSLAWRPESQSLTWRPESQSLTWRPESQSMGWRPESPRVQAFRQQLSKISLQKQVREAIAQAPQNAGPINSHMLVLRALALMRDASPDYLNRFMVYLDTLLWLDEAGNTRLAPKKNPSLAKTAKTAKASKT